MNQAVSMVPVENSVPEAATLVASHLRSIGFPGARAHLDGSGVPVVRTEHVAAVIVLGGPADAAVVEDILTMGGENGVLCCYSGNGYSPAAKALAGVERIALFEFDEAYTIRTVNKPAEILLDTVDTAPSDRGETVRLHLGLGSQVQSLMDSTASKLTAVGGKAIDAVKSGSNKQQGQLALSYVTQAVPIFEKAIGNGSKINPTRFVDELEVVIRLLQRAASALGLDYDRL